MEDCIDREHGLVALAAVLLERGRSSAAAERTHRTEGVRGRVAGIVVGVARDRGIGRCQLTLDAGFGPQLDGVADPVRITQVEFEEGPLEPRARRSPVALSNSC